MSIKLEQVIEKALNGTIDHCAFKLAWIPKGWVCVQAKIFSKELAKIIKSKEGKNYDITTNRKK